MSAPLGGPSASGSISLTATALHKTRRYGTFIFHVATNTSTGREHVVLVRGQVSHGSAILCRIQSECLTGTVLDASNCDCRDQLELSLAAIQMRDRGILILLRQEGRGHGLTRQIQALVNKNAGYDTFTAVEMLGVKADIRSFDEAAEILMLLNVRSVCLLANNPDKAASLRSNGIEVMGVAPLSVASSEDTKVHLQAKKDRGHNIQL